MDRYVHTHQSINERMTCIYDALSYQQDWWLQVNYPDIATDVSSEVKRFCRSNSFLTKTYVDYVLQNVNA